MLAEQDILRPPRQQAFYRNLASVMNLYGLADQTMWGCEPPNKFLLLHRKITLLCVPITIISQVAYLAMHYRTLTFTTLGVIFTILPIACVINVGVYSAQQASYKRLMKTIFDKIHLYNFKDLNDFARSKAIKVEHYTRWTLFFLTAFMITDCLLWIFLPVRHYYLNVERIENRTIPLQSMIYFWFPFDYSYNVRNWAILHVLNSYLIFSGAAVVITFNTVNDVFVIHLIGHIQILKYRFKSEFAGTLTDESIKEKLIALLKDHMFIVKTFKDVQNTFGFNVTANYCHNLFSDSILLYQIMFGKKSQCAMYGLMLFVYLGGLILMSTILEEVRREIGSTLYEKPQCVMYGLMLEYLRGLILMSTILGEVRRESDDLPDVIYSVPWENMSVSNQKILMMILARAQTPFEFISAGGLRAGVRPAVSIIKSTFSYYVMLKKTCMKADG